MPNTREYTTGYTSTSPREYMLNTAEYNWIQLDTLDNKQHQIG
jgi:hypothetical protein